MSESSPRRLKLRKGKKSNVEQEQQRILDSRSPDRQIVKELLNLSLSPRDDRTEKGISAFAKRLKNLPNGLQMLLEAVEAKGKRPTKCVLIESTMDGRMQVVLLDRTSKVFPFTHAYSIFRGQHSNKVRIAPIAACEGFFRGGKGRGKTCINPYHYNCEPLRFPSESLESPPRTELKRPRLYYDDEDDEFSPDFKKSPLEMEQDTIFAELQFTREEITQNVSSYGELGPLEVLAGAYSLSVKEFISDRGSLDALLDYC